MQNQSPKTAKELKELIEKDDFLLEQPLDNSTKIAAAAGLLEPAEKILEELLTNYEPLIEIKRRTIKLSRMDINIPILILGETGTGKELIARALHGARKNFVAVNCGGIPSELLESEFFGCVKGAFTGAYQDRIGYVERSHGGTLFLDEIGELPKDMQSKLLRVLECKKYNRIGSPIEQAVSFRLVSATNRCDLDDTKDFRSDLFYRISGHIINLPNLSERGSNDVRLIVEKFAKSPEIAFKILNDSRIKGPLKGNIRQLLNIIEEQNVLS